MSAFVSVFKREAAALGHSRFMLFAVFCLPFVFVLLSGAIFFSGTARKLPVAVLDEDGGSVSHMVIRALNSAPALSVKYKVSDAAEGERLLKNASAYALIIIPRGFQKDLNMQRRPKLVYYYNNQMIAVGGLVSRDVKTTVQTLLAGLTAETLKKRGVPAKAVLKKTNLIHIDERIRGNPYFNYSYFLMYTMIAHTFQAIIMLTAVWAAGSEFKYGTAKDWLAAADGNIFCAVTGKLALYFMLFFALMNCAYVAYAVFYDAPFTKNYAFFAAATALFIMAYQSVGIIFCAVLHNCREAMSAGGVLGSLGFTLAGMTYPNLAMTSFVRGFSSLLPVSHYVPLLTDQILRGVPPACDFKYIYMLAAFTVAGLCFLPLLKKNAQDESLCFAD